jgi:hypothetical protein
MSIERQESALSPIVYRYSRAVPRRPAQRGENTTIGVIIVRRAALGVTNSERRATEQTPLRALAPEGASVARVTHSSSRPSPIGQQQEGEVSYREALPSSPTRADRERLQGCQHYTDKDEKRDETIPYEVHFIHLGLQTGFGVAKTGAAGQATAQSIV